MPSRYSSDALVAATPTSWPSDSTSTRRRCRIEDAHRASRRRSADVLGGEPEGLTDENLQSRIRGVLMMAISNATGAIVLTTGNKSEMAVGYSTLYGDSAGGFAVIKDVPKTLVYELCRYRNELARRDGDPEPIPQSVLDKAPSAELRRRSARRPVPAALRVLDPLLELYVEDDATAEEIIALGLRPRPRHADHAPRRSQRVQASPDAAGRAHLEEGVRTRPAHAHHQRLSTRSLMSRARHVEHLFRASTRSIGCSGECAAT